MGFGVWGLGFRVWGWGSLDVQSAALAIHKKRDKQASDAKSKNKALQKLLASSPEDLLNQAIDQRIAAQKSPPALL